MKRTLRLLVVDDMANWVAKVVRTLLSSELEVECLTASSAKEALSQIPGAPPDCVISDYNMEGMDGLELARILANRGIPTLILTAQTISPDLRALAEQSGAEHIVSKQSIASGKWRLLQCFAKKHAREMQGR